MLLQETGTYLGPARVVAPGDPQVRIRIHDEDHAARLALAVPYRPEEGDQVLVIGQGAAYYVIGVLEGRGRTVLDFPGDVELRARKGEVRLTSAKRVAVRAPEVEVDGDAVELRGRTLVQRFGEAFQWVTGLFQLRAGRARSVVEGSHHQHAERVFVRAKEEAKIDGRQIHLG